MTLMEYKKHMEILERLTKAAISNKEVAQAEENAERKAIYERDAELEYAKIAGYLWAIKVSAGEEARDLLEEYAKEYRREQEKAEG